jgi:hypothetical protein
MFFSHGGVPSQTLGNSVVIPKCELGDGRRMSANSFLGTATSAIRKATQRPWLTTFDRTASPFDSPAGFAIKAASNR